MRRCRDGPGVRALDGAGSHPTNPHGEASCAGTPTADGVRRMHGRLRQDTLPGDWHPHKTVRSQGGAGSTAWPVLERVTVDFENTSRDAVARGRQVGW